MEDYLRTQELIEEEAIPKPYNEYLDSIYVSDEMRDFIEPIIYEMVFNAAEIGS